MNIFQTLILSLVLVVKISAQGVTMPQALNVLIGSGSVELKDRTGKKHVINMEASGEKRVQALILRAGESLQTSKGTSCDLVIPDAGTMRLQPESGVALPAKPSAEQKQQHSLKLLKGKLFLDVDTEKLKANKEQFRLKTPTTILAVKGTRFFAQTNEVADTAGVHKGSVIALESESGKYVSLKQGSAVEAKAGALGNPRRMTPEETAEAAVYDSFALDFSLAEKGTRKFTGRYEVNDDPNTAIPSLHKEFISVKKTDDKDIRGKVIKVRVLPFPKAPKVSVYGITEVKIRAPRAVPEGISFALRVGPGIKRISAYGAVIEYKKVLYGIRPVDRNIDIPEGTRPDQWITFFLPVEPLDYVYEEGKIIFGLGPHLHEGRAVPSLCHVEQGMKEYVFEIGPISVATRPRK